MNGIGALDGVILHVPHTGINDSLAGVLGISKCNYPVTHLARVFLGGLLTAVPPEHRGRGSCDVKMRRGVPRALPEDSIERVEVCLNGGEALGLQASCTLKNFAQPYLL